MKTAVIILNWNGRDLLRKYLPDVVRTVAQVADAEVVVADNASTDGSREVLAAEFPSVRVLPLDKNYGFAGGYNRALQMVDHEYVVMLNSDVAPADGWLQPLVDLMDAKPDVAACAPKIRDDKDRQKFEYAGAAGGFVDRFGFPFCRGRVMGDVEEDNGQYDDDADVLWVSGAAFMVRRELYNTVGGLDEDFFAHMEEIDLCWRFVNAGHRVVACGKSQVYHLGGATLNATDPRKVYLNFRNNLSMLFKNHNSRWWLLVVFCRMVLDGLAGLAYLLSAKVDYFNAVLQAHLSFWFSIVSLIRKRKKLAKGRNRILVNGVRPYSMVIRHVLMRKKTFKDLES